MAGSTCRATPSREHVTKLACHTDILTRARIGDSERVIPFVITTYAADRDRDIVSPACLDHVEYLANPIFL